MPRQPPEQRITVTLERNLIEAIDEIAGSFEDSFVSRGQVIEMAFAYVLADDDRITEAFGAEAGEEGEGENPEVGGDEDEPESP